MSADLQYQSGFGHEFSSEAVAGALPRAQNAPQQAPLGLYVEELNGTSFTAPRGVSRATWTYRIRPSTVHKPFRQIGNGLIRTGPFNETPPTPKEGSMFPGVAVIASSRRASSCSSMIPPALVTGR